MLNRPSSGSTNPSIQPIPLLNPLLASQRDYLLEDRFFKTDSYPFDPSLPLVSPLNPNMKLYPPSTRNYFNIDILAEPNTNTYPGYPYANYPVYNIFRPNPFRDYVSTPTNEKITFNPNLTPSKEVSMQNKILINEENELERTLTPSFKPISEDKPLEVVNLELKKQKDKETNQNPIVVSKVNEFERKTETNEELSEKDVKNIPQTFENKKKIKRPSIDMNLIEDSETGKIFSASIANVYGKDLNAIVKTQVSNLDTKNPPQEEKNENARTPINQKFNMIKNDKNADLTISPKSAFVKMK
jgi:hypothetical protein